MDGFPAGAARQRRPVKLGHWKWPAQLFLGALVFVSLILPGLALLFWLWRGWQQEWAVHHYSELREQN